MEKETIIPFDFWKTPTLPGGIFSLCQNETETNLLYIRSMHLYFLSGLNDFICETEYNKIIEK